MNDAIILENKAYWTQRAPGYSQVNQQELATGQRRVWKQTLVKHISQRFPHRCPGDIHVLEVGTGPGFFAILLAEEGYQVTAIDLTPSMLVQARRNAGPLVGRIDFMEMNAQSLRFGDERFDVILSRNVTWNLPEPEKAYAEWTRVLKPGGLLLNFDANWYRYLHNEDARMAYQQDRQNSAAQGLGDFNVGDGFDRMEAIACRMPLTRADRPAWDLETLAGLGMDVEADPHVWKHVWSRQEKVNLASTPMFMVRGYKSA